jgi:hypothetical protein
MPLRGTTQGHRGLLIFPYRGLPVFPPLRYRGHCLSKARMSFGKSQRQWRPFSSCLRCLGMEAGSRRTSFGQPT